MSRLSDDEKRVFTDRIAELKAELEMVQDALRHALNDDAGWDLQAKAMIEPFNRKTFYQQHKELGRENDRLEEENTLLAEHNQALLKGIKNINWRAKTESLDKHLRNVVIGLTDDLLGGDDANTD